MDGLEGAAHGQGLAHFLQGQVRFAGQKGSKSLLVPLNQSGFAPGVTVAGPQVAGAAALLKELLDQAQGNPEAAGDFLAGAFLLVVSGQDPFAQVQGDCSHQPRLTSQVINGYSFI